MLVAATAQAQTAPPSEWWIHIANDRVAQVRNLLKAGVDPNAFGPQGLPAAMFAVTEGAWGVYDLLVGQRATDINLENGSRESLLMFVALVNDAPRADALIRKGAAVNKLGWTPLMYAASTGSNDTVKLLLDRKAIVNAPGPQGETALMMAAAGGHEPVVRQLLAAGADATLRDQQGRNAGDWARMKNNTVLGQQLDTLVQTVLAQREAQRNPVPAAAVPVQPKAAEPAPRPAEAASDSSGTQRYFDLKRFE